MIRQIEQKIPWLYWLVYYSPFILAAIAATIIYNGFFGISNTDVNSARYLLSAIIQAEAAIIAIVISLTLVAMQMVASSYSPRVARIFSSGSQMIGILVFYIIAIAYGAIILQILKGETGSILPSQEYLVSFSLWLAVFLMLALVPYIRNTLKSLQPDTIIQRECERISESSIQSSLSQSNPLDLIFDILHPAIMKYDTGLIKDQLPRITQSVNAVLSTPLSDNEIIEITQDYSQRLTVCAQQAIQLDDLESTRIILETLKDLTGCTISLANDDASRQVIDSLQLLEKASANRKSWDNLSHIIDVLADCGKQSIDRNLIMTTARISLCLKEIGQHSIDLINPDDAYGPFVSLAQRTIDTGSGFARYAITHNRNAVWDTTIMYLADVAKYCRNKNNPHLAPLAGDKILDLWLLAVQNKIEIPAFQIAAYESYHSRNLLVKLYGYCPFTYENKIMQIGIAAIINGLQDSADTASRLLADFRLLDVQNYNVNLNRFFENLQDEKEKAAYHQIFEMSVKFAKEKNPNI